MNIIDILVLLVLAFSLFAGMYKGFLASGLSLLGLVGSWFGALRLYPAVARLALENQTLMGVLSNYLEPATFFEDMAISGVSAQTSVSELVARGGEAVNAVADYIGSRVPFLRDAFASNISSEAFSALNIHTLAEYFDQTLWQSVFGVLAFIVCFIALYFLATLLVNLLNHVLRFPAGRRSRSGPRPGGGGADPQRRRAGADRLLGGSDEFPQAELGHLRPVDGPKRPGLPRRARHDQRHRAISEPAFDVNKSASATGALLP